MSPPRTTKAGPGAARHVLSAPSHVACQLHGLRAIFHTGPPRSGISLDLLPNSACQFRTLRIDPDEELSVYFGEMRRCTDCGLLKPLDDEHYLPIKACRRGWYGRCRECRNRRARERYHSTCEIRQAEIARSRRNNLKRRANRSVAA